MRTYRASLVTVAPVPSAFPPVSVPEIAVVGRSNSGKSTLINTMVGQRHLARVSGRPGKTRAIIFFDVEEKFMLADLPGYGFARAPKSEQEDWRRLVGAYMGRARPIAGVIALFDIRRKPDDLDFALVSMLNRHRLAWRAVWTKADKLKKAQLKSTASGLDDVLGCRETGLVFSSKTRLGRDDLWRWIDSMVQKPQDT